MALNQCVRAALSPQATPARHLFVFFIEPMLVHLSQTLQGIKFFDK